MLEWANLRFVTLQNNLAKIIRKSGRHFIFKDAYQSGDINTTFLWRRPKPNLLLPREIRIKTLGCQPGWNVIEIGLSFIFQIMSSLLPTNSGWRVNPSPFRTRFAHNVFFLTLHKLVTVKKAHFSILFYLCQCNDRLLSMTRALKSPSVPAKRAPAVPPFALIFWEKCGTHIWTNKKGNIHIGKTK